MTTEIIQLSFGEKFKQLRETSRRTVAETAALLKKPLGSYLKLEIDFLHPSESMLRRIARLYNITYQDLLAHGEKLS